MFKFNHVLFTILAFNEFMKCLPRYNVPFIKVFGKGQGSVKLNCLSTTVAFTNAKLHLLTPVYKF